MTPVFQTPRILARRWTLEDAPAALEIYGDPEVMHFLGDGTTPPVATLDIMRTRLQRRIESYDKFSGYGAWSIVDRALDKIVGTVILQPLETSGLIEVGWHLARKFWGQGYATEAGRACMQYGFDELKLDQIVAVVNPANARSLAVTKRLNMAHEGRRHFYSRDLEFFTADQATWPG